MTYEPTEGDPELAAVIRQRLDELKAERQARTDRWCAHCLKLLRDADADTT